MHATLQTILGKKSVLISLMLIVTSVLLWWDYTLVSVILLVIAIFVIVTSCCAEIELDITEKHDEFSKYKKYTQIIKSQKLNEDEIDEIFKMQFDEAVRRLEGIAPSGKGPREILIDLPFEILEGISIRMSGRVSKIGVEFLKDILNVEENQLANICEVDLNTVQSWICDAKSIIIGAGIKHVAQLATCDPFSMKEDIETAFEIGEIVPPSEYKITIEKIKYWISAARDEIARTKIVESKEWTEDREA